MKKFIGCITAVCSIGLVFAFNSGAIAQEIPLPSENWQPISRNQSNDLFLLDRGTIGRQGNFVGFWTQINHRAGGIAVSRVYNVGNCSTNVTQPLWLVQASIQGQIIRNEKTPIEQNINTPGSVGRILLDAACGNSSPEVQAQTAQAEIVKAQLEALTRFRQTNADAINNAMRTTADMFK